MNARPPRMAPLLLAIGALALTAAAQDRSGAATAPLSAAPLALQAAEDPWNVVDLQPTADPRPVLRREERATGSDDKGVGSGVSWWRGTLSLAGVVGLIFVLAWGYRVATGAAGLPLARSRKPGLIEIVSRSAISPQHLLVLVRVGPRLLLVGTTKQSLCTLDVIADEDLAARLIGEAFAARPESSSADFHRSLERELAAGARSQPATRAGGDAQRPAGAAPIGEVRRALVSTIERVRNTTRRV